MSALAERANEGLLCEGRIRRLGREYRYFIRGASDGPIISTHGARSIEGLTAVGRATVDVLAMNDIRRVELRGHILARHELR